VTGLLGLVYSPCCVSTGRRERGSITRQVNSRPAHKTTSPYSGVSDVFDRSSIPMEDAMRVDLYPGDDVCSYACRLTRRCVIPDQPVRKHGQISVWCPRAGWSRTPVGPSRRLKQMTAGLAFTVTAGEWGDQEGGFSVGLMAPRKANGAARATSDESADFHAMESRGRVYGFQVHVM
jgi:hypothetical protein